MIGYRRARDPPFRLAEGAQRLGSQLMSATVLPKLRSIPGPSRVLCGGGIGELCGHNPITRILLIGACRAALIVFSVAARPPARARSLRGGSHGADQSQATMTEKPNEPSTTSDPAFTIADLISDLQKRAKSRRRESWSILSVMLVLLLGAGYVFTQAKEIATNDTSINTTVRQQELENKLAVDTHRLDSLREQAGSVKIDLPFLGDINGKLTKTVNGPFYCEMPLIDKQGDIMSVTELIKKLKEIVDSSYPCPPRQKGAVIEVGKPHVSLILFGSDVGAAAQYVLTFDPSLLTNTYSKLISENYPAPLADKEAVKAVRDEFSSTLHTVQAEGDAIQRLQKARNEVEINQLTGQKGETSAGIQGVNSLQFLIQLNIVRFGTISIIGIAIGILAPLYRFAARLAAFYQAKADTLRLHEIAYKHTSFASLSSALTPPMEFGKSQPIPDYLTTF
jgi:hypothetical protein